MDTRIWKQGTPNAPALVGLNFWVQACVAPPNLPPRFSNTLAVTVQ